MQLEIYRCTNSVGNSTAVVKRFTTSIEWIGVERDQDHWDDHQDVEPGLKGPEIDQRES